MLWVVYFGQSNLTYTHDDDTLTRVTPPGMIQNNPGLIVARDLKETMYADSNVFYKILVRVEVLVRERP